MPRSSKSLPLAFREYIVLFFGASTLAFTAWSLAGYKEWCLHTLVVGSMCAFIFSMIPMSRQLNGLDCLHANDLNYKRFFKSPGICFSLFFLLYLCLQGLNPAAEIYYKADGTRWMRELSPRLGFDWPTSVDSFYKNINSWRVTLIYLSGFALFWGFWIGLQRRKSVLVALWVFVISGSSMGLVALLMDFTDTKLLLWTFPSNNPSFWGSFAYRNHGAAYLNLSLIAIGFLFFYYLKKTRSRGHSGGPHLLLFCMFTLVLASVIIALSRGGIIFGSIIGAVFFILCLTQAVGNFFEQAGKGLPILCFALLSSAAYVAYIQIDPATVVQRFGDVDATIKNVDRDARMLSSCATWDMAQDRLIFGWGAGAFRYHFPKYQQHYPSIMYSRYHKKKGWIGRKTYHYAHNDILQFLAEYGLVGCSFLIALLSILFWILVRSIERFTSGVLILLLGLFVMLSHAFIDFTLSSPAYLIATIGFYALAAKLLILERRHAAVISAK